MLQNPFNGGAALATMGRMAEYNPLANAGQRLGEISQLNQRDALGELMAANGGQVDYSMAPTALLATPEAQKMFGYQQGLVQGDRQMDLTEQNNLWGHQDRQASTGASIANSKRSAGTAANRLAYDRQSAKDLLARGQLGQNQVYDYLNQANQQTTQGPVGPNGVGPATVDNPLYPSRNGTDITAPMAELVAKEYGKQTANQQKIGAQSAKDSRTASSKLFGEQVQAKIDLLKSQNKSAVDQAVINRNNAQIDALAQLGGTVGDTAMTVNPQSTKNINNLPPTSKF